MKLKHLLLAAMTATLSLGASAAETTSSVRIYINPGHGSFTGEDRPMSTIKHGHQDNKTVSSDTTSFFESNTNLQKAFGLLEKLKEYGVPYNSSIQANNANQPNLRMSHVKCGVSPSLTVIAEEAETGNFDMFISIHSNATTGDHNELTHLNHCVYLFRGYDGNPSVKESDKMGEACWPHSMSNKHMNYNWLADPTRPRDNNYTDNWTWGKCGYYPDGRDADNNPKWVKGDLSYNYYKNTEHYGDYYLNNGIYYKGFYAVLRHKVPGFLVEGFDHTYKPATHRAMNDDVCRHEGEMYAKGINDYFGWGKKDSYGKIYGIVRDHSVVMTHEYYAVKSVGSTRDANQTINQIDNKKPLNNVRVALYNSNGVEIDSYTTDDEWNGAYFFKKVAPGTYTIKHSLGGYQEVSQTVTVTANETNYLNIDMRTTSAANAVQGHYAYGLKLTKTDDYTYTASFKSTGAMSNGKIILTNSSTKEQTAIETGAIKKGDNSVAIDATKLDDGVNYSWSVAFDNPASNGYNLITSKNSIVSSGATIGLAIDNDETSTNFGTIYTNTGLGVGIQKFNPDFSTDDKKVITGKFGADGYASRLTINNGKVYIANYSTTNPGVWVYNPSASTASATQIWSGRATGVTFYGEGSSRKMYTTYPYGRYAYEFNIGASDAVQSTYSKTLTNFNGILYNDGDIFATDKGLFFSQRRFTNGNDEGAPAFALISYSDVINYNSYVLGETANGGDGTLLGTERGGMALSKDQKTFAIASGIANDNDTGSSINIHVYSVSWNGNKPSFSHQYYIPLSGTNRVDQMAFDHADNLYVASQQQGLLVYAIKNPSRQTVTNGSGTITGAKPLTKVYIVGNSSSIGDWDPAKAVEFTNNGNNYTITLNEPITEFKISTGKGETSGDWTAFDAGNLTTNESITNGGTINLIAQHSYNNFVLPWAGVWTITVAGDLSTLTASTSTPKPLSPLYIVGNSDAIGNWDTNNAVEFTDNHTNYTITLDESVTEFKISTNKGDLETFNNGNLTPNAAITNGGKVNLTADKDGVNIVLPWEGVWNITVAADLSTLTATTSTPQPLYIVGNSDNVGAWDTNNAVKFSHDGSNYTFTLDESATEFKISTSKGDLETFNNGNRTPDAAITNGGTVRLSVNKEGNNIVLPWAGVWNIKVANDFSTLTATTSTPRPLYIVGTTEAIGAWDPNKAVKIAHNGTNYNITLDENVKAFKISTNKGDWSAFDAGNLTFDAAITNGGTVNLRAEWGTDFILPWEGIWDITIANDLSTLTAFTSTPDPNVGPEIGPEPENAPNPDAETPETPEADEPEDAQTEGYFAYALSSSKSGNDYVFNFKSTGARKNGIIILTNTSTNKTTEIKTGAIKKGENTINVNAYDIPKGTYTWAVKLQNNANSTVTQVGNNADIVQGNGRIGVAIDNDQTSKNFGAIYTITGIGKGLQKFNADMSKSGGMILTGKFGQESGTTNRSNRLEVNGGKVYIANYAADNPGVWVYDPNGSETVTRVSGGGYYERAIAFYGEGANRKAFSSHLNAKQVQRFDIGTNTTWTSNSPSAYFYQAGVLDNGDGDIVATNNAVIVSQNRFAGNNLATNPAFVVLDYNMNLKYKSNVINGTLNGTNNGGMAITPDFKTFAIADSHVENSGADISVQVYSVTWSGSTPTFTHQYSFKLSGTQQVDQMEFDHAGNLLIASRQKGLLKWAVKTSARTTTTNALSSYTITGMANPAPSNVVATRKCKDEGNNTTAGTVDAEITWSGDAGKYRIYYQTMRRDASGNRIEDNSTWQLAGEATIASGTTGNYTHKNLAHGGDYARIYNYKVVNYYSDADYEGLSKSISGKGRTVTSYPPQVPVNVAFSQSSVEVDGVTQYTLNPQLNISLNEDVFNASLLDDNDEPVKATKYVIVVDEATAAKLNAASNVKAMGRFYRGPATMTANNCNHFTINDWYMVVDIEDVTPSDDLSKATKSIVWKDVDLTYTYKPQVYTSAVRTFNFTANNPESAAYKINLPSPQWNANSNDGSGMGNVAEAIPVKGNIIESLAGNEDYPMGTFQKIGDIENPTNPISITEANVIGAVGCIDPIPVTDEILNEWDITYTLILKDKEGNVISEAVQENNATNKELYSNVQKRIVDILGLNVGRDETTAPDGRARYTYNAEKNDNYTLVVRTNYRKTVDGELVEMSNESESSITVNPSFPNPELDTPNCPGYVFLEESTHWDEKANVEGDEDEYGGYFKYFYDVAMDIKWQEFNDNLVRYMGYYSKSNTGWDCIGHPVESNIWTPYQAASILTDEVVGRYNNRITNNNKDYSKAQLKGIGYTGSENWSALATEAGHFPIKVHYVWAGNDKLTDKNAAQIKWELSANYPVVIYDEPMIKVSSSYQEGVHDISAPLTRNAVGGKDMYVITTTNQQYKELTMDGIIEVKDEITTGVEDVNVAKGTLRLYPNPANSVVTLQAWTVLDDVKVFTIDGQLVKEFETDDTKVKFNVSDLPSGVYIIHAAGATTRMIKR